MSSAPSERKAEALGSSLRLKAVKKSERQYLDAMGLLSGQHNGDTGKKFTVDMRSFNEHTLSGKYHVFRIKNKFPIPGGAVADDFYRRRLIEQNASRAKALRNETATRARQLEVAGRTFDKQQQLALPTAIERLVIQADATIEAHSRQKQEAVESLQGHVGDAAEVKRVFSLIRGRKVTQLEGLFATGEISVNMVEPALLYSGLILSSSHGLLTTVRQYLRHGANPNLRTASGFTALHVAWDAWLKINPHIPKKQFQKDATFSIIKELLKYKADPNIKTSNGTSALHMACQYGHEPLVIEMLKHGADRTLIDNFGRSAEDVAVEQCAKGNKDRRGCLGILRNWDILCAQHASAEFESAWKLTMEATNQYAAAMAAQAKQGGGSVLPQAGVVDVTAQGGSDAPLIAAAKYTSQALWGDKTDVSKMLHTFSVREKIFDHRELKGLETVQFDPHQKSLPLLLDLRSRTASTASSTRGATKLPIGVDSSASAVHKKRLKAQWEAANAPQAAAEDAAARQAVYSQATKLSTASRCARLDKIIPDEQSLLEDTLAIAKHKEVANLQRLRLLEAKNTNGETPANSHTSNTAAEQTILELNSRLKSAAFSVVDDAKPAVELHASSGEHFVRRPALQSALLRPSRLRIDNRTVRGMNGTLSQDMRADQVDAVDSASVQGVPSPSLAVDTAALEMRKEAQGHSSSAIGADKAEVEAAQQPKKGFLDDMRLLPALGSYAQQAQQKRDDLKAQAISNKLVGQPPPAGYHAKASHQQAAVPRKLDAAGNNLHYGNPTELFTASEKPPAHGVLHAGGSINLGTATSMMSVSTLDVSEAAHLQAVAQVGASLGVVAQARPAQYGIRKALEHVGDEMPSFAESQQVRAWKKSKSKNLYNEVAALKKQWLKSGSLFGRPEEPWQNGGVAAATETLPDHTSKRPPKGFKRIRNGQVVYL